MLFVGTDGKDSIEGTKSADIIYGGSGNDSLIGRGGADTIYDGLGNDKVKGGRGDDTFFNIGGDKDKFNGGMGVDTLIDNYTGQLPETTGKIVLDLESGVRFDKADSSNQDTIVSIENWTFIGDQNVKATGDANDNVLTSDKGEDVLKGGDGDDTLSGGANSDRLLGGDGDDTLHGGTGRDKLFGNDGADTFIFLEGDGKDVIKDYSDAEDQILIDVAYYDTGDSIAEFLGKVGAIDGSDAVLTFSDGHSLTIKGVSSLTTLTNNIDFI